MALVHLVGAHEIDYRNRGSKLENSVNLPAVAIGADAETASMPTNYISPSDCASDRTVAMMRSSQLVM